MEKKENKTEEQLLKESEEKYRRLYNSIRDSILVADSNRNIIDCNPAFSSLFGYAKDEIIGKQTIYVYENEAEFKELGQDIKAHYGDKPFLKTVNYKKKSGEIFPGETNVFYLKDNKGEVSGFIGLIRDITERKQAEKEIKRFSRIFEDSLNELYLFDAETLKFTQVNAAAQQNLGYSMGELQKMTPLDIKPKISEEQFSKLVAPLRSGEKDIIVFETVHQRKDKSLYNVEVHLQLLHFEKEVIFTAIILDITERKLSEKTLIDSEEKFRKAFGTSPDSININRLEDGLYVEINSGFTQIMGYAADEIIGKTSIELNIWADSSARNKLVAGLQANGFVENFEAKFCAKSGEIKEGSMSAAVIELNGVPHILSITRDITERKKAEEEIKKVRDRYKALITVSNTGAWEYNNDTDFLWCSPEYFSMLGRDVNQFDITGKSNLKETWIDLLHPDDRERANNHFANYLKNGSIGMYENNFRMKHSDGHWVWILSRGRTLHDSEGKITNITVGTHIDITEQKQTEEALRQSKDKYQKLSLIKKAILESPEGIIVFALDENYCYLDFTLLHKQTMKAIWGADIEIGSSMLSFIKNEKDREKAKANFDKALAGDRFILMEEYGNEKLERTFYENRYSPIYNDKNTIVGFSVFVVDITERKKAEKELSKYREHLEQLVKERTKEVDEKNQKLSDQMKIFVGRELKIRDLENRIRALQGK